MAVSYHLAEEAWENWLDVQAPATQQHVLRAYKSLKANDADWLMNALHQPFRQVTTLADAAAYVWLSGEIAAGRVFLCLGLARSWAHPDRNVELNKAAIENTNLEVGICSGTQGYDGYVNPLSPVPMRRLFLDDDSTPDLVTPEFNIGESFPLEIGHCNVAKCAKILEWHGRLARLPYQIRMNGLHPRLYLLALHPDDFKERLELRAAAFSELF